MPLADSSFTGQVILWSRAAVPQPAALQLWAAQSAHCTVHSSSPRWGVGVRGQPDWPAHSGAQRGGGGGGWRRAQSRVWFPCPAPLAHRPARPPDTPKTRPR